MLTFVMTIKTWALFDFNKIQHTILQTLSVGWLIVIWCVAVNHRLGWEGTHFSEFVVHRIADHCGNNNTHMLIHECCCRLCFSLIMGNSWKATSNSYHPEVWWLVFTVGFIFFFFLLVSVILWKCLFRFYDVSEGEVLLTCFSENCLLPSWFMWDLREKDPGLWAL